MNPLAAGTGPIDTIRRFNRWYTARIGLLDEGLHRSEFSLTDARVMYELRHGDGPTAKEVAGRLGLDPGYLSRVLGRLERKQLIARTPARSDRRRRLLTLTDAGETVFAQLDGASDREVQQMLEPLSDEARRSLLGAMQTIRSLLEPELRQPRSYVLRDPLPGDLGWVVQRHGALYRSEYGWDERFEGLVAGVIADYVQRHDPKRERCWIADVDGSPVGSVFLVKAPGRSDVARLRLLIVEPGARGLGIGRRLVQECSRFARQAGYRKITLWTNSILIPARRLYEAEGYVMISSEPHTDFGHGLIGETWELTL